MKSRHRHIWILGALFLFVSVMLAACAGGGGGTVRGPETEGGPSVAALTSTIPPGDPDCPYGGVLVETGIDDNKNSILDPEEVDSTQKVCNGAPGPDGLNALVTLTQEPRGENCARGGVRIDAGIDTDLDGVLDPGEVTSTEYLCNNTGDVLGWGIAAPIETDNAGDVWAPQVAVDGSGNAVAVWYQYDGIRYNIWANRYVPGFGWGTAALIETDNARDAWNPQVAVDGSGNAVAVWRHYDGTRNSAWSNRYVVGTGWGTAELIETDNVGNVWAPQVAVDGSGNAVAVWDQSDGTRDNIWANRYVPGFGWGTAVLIETDNAGHAYYPQVAVDGSGNAVVVWNQSDGTRDSTWSNRYEVGTGWGTAMLIESDNAGDASNVQVAVDGSGNAVAVWYQSDGTRDSTWANRYVVGTGWGSAMLIESDNAGDASNVQVAVDGSGNAVAVWQQSDGTRTNIWANRYVVGTGWGSTALIETANVGSAFSPQVAVDGSGNAVAVWQQSDGTRHNIWANRFVAGDDSGSFIPESSFLGIWMRQDGSNAGIYGKEYLGDGTGYLGNFSSGPFERATPFTWSLSGNVSTEDRFAAIYHEEIVYLEGADMEQRREEDGKTRVWRKQ